MLEHFFGSKTRLKLLHIFFTSPSRSFFVRELSRLTEIQLNAIRREIANLEQAGTIRQVEESFSATEGGGERAKYYQLDPGFFLYAELKALIVKAQLLQEQAFIEEIKKRGGRLQLFLLTGLFASDAKADTDILLVGDLKFHIISKLIKDLEKNLGRTIRYTLMEVREFKERQEIGDVFLYRIFQSKYFTVVDEVSP